MEIRVAEYNDYERIAAMHARSWRLNYRGIMDENYLLQDVEDDRKIIWQARLINSSINQHVLLVEDDGILCGFICAFGNHDFEKGSIIESFHIAPEYQGRGLKQLLLREMAKWIEHYFPDSGVYIEIVEQNTEAQEFYDHLGGLHSTDKIWHTPCGTDIPENIYTWATPKDMLQAIG
jgi:GNAT superfamily N-acetyltransferase